MRELPILFSTPMVQAILDDRKSMTRRVVKGLPDDQSGCDLGIIKTSSGELTGYGFEEMPYQPGDLLYVRETWADNIPGCPNGITYKADHIDPKGDGPANPIKWKPSIHMPKAAARIWLEVTNVRVERLQEILCGDMKREGCIPPTVTGGQYQQWQRDYWIPLWDAINAKRGYGWETNPWVWVIEFERANI